MEVGHREARQRLSSLIDRACVHSNPALDATLLAGIKTLCRQSDENVALAWEALWGHLRAPHAQVCGPTSRLPSLCHQLQQCCGHHSPLTSACAECSPCP